MTGVIEIPPRPNLPNPPLSEIQEPEENMLKSFVEKVKEDPKQAAISLILAILRQPLVFLRSLIYLKHCRPGLFVLFLLNAMDYYPRQIFLYQLDMIRLKPKRAILMAVDIIDKIPRQMIQRSLDVASLTPRCCFIVCFQLAKFLTLSSKFLILLAIDMINALPSWLVSRSSRVAASTRKSIVSGIDSFHALPKQTFMKVIDTVIAKRNDINRGLWYIEAFQLKRLVTGLANMHRFTFRKRVVLFVDIIRSSSHLAVIIVYDLRDFNLWKVLDGILAWTRLVDTKMVGWGVIPKSKLATDEEFKILLATS